VQDRAEMQREVLLWQRWLRYAAAVFLVGVILLFGVMLRQQDWVQIVAVGAGYVGFAILLMGGYLKATSGRRLRIWVPGVVVLADLALVTALIYLSSPPSQFHRVLLLGFLVVQLAVFYFGRTLGIMATALTVTSYVCCSLFVRPYVDGPRPTYVVVTFNALVFLFVGAVLVRVFGSFHERMSKLRVFLKRAEMGDLSGTYDADADRAPDDLTLLGRSFNEMRNRLIELIGSDPLIPGCLNRRALESRLSREWRQAKRRSSTLAVLEIDVDHFKQINDTHGHPVGDMVLRQLGEVMCATARETDAVARMGGDEFVVLLPDTASMGAMTFAERLRKNVDERQFGDPAAPLPITISVGVVVAKGSDPINPTDLLERADRALYKAKSAGRNRICA
jgi:diguanylate cyclase (GGDEF)-like protein